MALETPFPSFHYHPHQEEGIRWMMNQEDDVMYCCGGILADEMGLGKTWETIGLLLNNPVPYTLLIVPPVLQGQWSDALALADIPHTILLGPHRLQRIAGKRTGVAVVLATYDRAARNKDFLEEEYTFGRIVCDEGHILRNGGRSKRFNKLEDIPTERRWLLTGTPVQNREADFRNLLKWLRAEYNRKEHPLSLLAEEIMLRRTVADVRETVPAFPEMKPTHYIHPVTMPEGGEERRIFDVLVRRMKSAIASHVDNFMILELYLRIRQFLAHPQIYRDAMAKKYKTESGPWEHSASKIAKLAEVLAGTPKTPTLLFTTFTEEMNYADEVCRAAGYKTWRICGGLGAAGIDAAVRKSREAVAGGEEAVVVLVQIQAGNAGINLQHLSRIVFLSSHWNPAMVDQAIGRSYRIGQTKAVEVHHVLLADGAEKNLDRYMARMHAKKRGIAKKICEKLACDSAAEAGQIFTVLNAVCPDEFGMSDSEAGEEEDVGNAEVVEEGEEDGETDSE